MQDTKAPNIAPIAAINIPNTNGCFSAKFLFADSIVASSDCFFISLSLCISSANSKYGLLLAFGFLLLINIVLKSRAVLETAPKE